MEILEGLYILLGCLVYIQAGEDTWTKKIKSYKPHTLLSGKMRKIAELSDSKSEQKYFRDVLLAPMLIVREPDTEGSKIVREHIKSFMTSYGWAIEEDQFTDDTPLGPKKFTNVIATQDTNANIKFVIACHYDSKMFKQFKFVGATDSAVPCAMMLDLARLMNSTLWKRSKQNPDVSLQFLFFDGEEAYVRWKSTDSLYGARHLAKVMEDTPVAVGREVEVPQLKTISVFILLDLIGTSTCTFRNWFHDTEKMYERFVKIESKLDKENLLKKSSSSHKYFKESLDLQGSGGIQDDHIPFHQRGVPILHLISYPFPAEWHKESDNMSALDFPTIDNISKILRVFVAEYLHLQP